MRNHCHVCGPRVAASFKVLDKYTCRRHLSVTVEQAVAKGGAVLVGRLG